MSDGVTCVMTQDNEAASTPRRALIVDDEAMVGMGLKTQLERFGHAVVGQAPTAEKAVELFDSCSPDLVLLDIRLSGEGDGIDLARTLLAKRRCPMIIVSAYSDPELIARAGQAGVYGYLIKPVTGEALAAQIEIAVRRFNDAEALRREKLELTQAMIDRKIVERAKGIYMKRLRLDEPSAHRRLQLEAQRRRITVVQFAQKIIESEELLEK